ncbi:MAG: hypothetical protein JSU96_19145 [Acidobacteriota bacterium]|nr:MAG: hypothetical protein JSU96_19145 [Acidobacteriota bacterium]
MCEQCTKVHETCVEPYQPEEDDCCDYFPDDMEDDPDGLVFFCPEEPRYVVTETYVEDHLCDRHAGQEAEEMADAEAFLEYVGLGTGKVVPIEAKGDTCEFIDFLNPGAPPCEEPASYASIVTQEFLVCGEHLHAFASEEKVHKVH